MFLSALTEKLKIFCLPYNILYKIAISQGWLTIGVPDKNINLVYKQALLF